MRPSRRHSVAAAIAVAASLAAPLSAAPAALADGWGEPHLRIIPLSAEDAGRVARVTAPPRDFSAPEPFELRPAGAATHVGRLTNRPFSLPSANMAQDRGLDFQLGKGLFEKLWAAAPSATTASDGLGPLYNARACKSCHVDDGRGHPPAGPEDYGVSMVLRLALPDAASDLPAETRAYLAHAPDPVYGGQLQDRSVAGFRAEGRVRIGYETFPVAFSDGTVIELRRPSYGISRPAYGPLHPETSLSARIAPPMIGLGLLEAVPEVDILALADPGDADGDGISGRPNRVWSLEHDQWMLGRFGWKAGQPTVRQQVSDAFLNDIGISTPLHRAPWGDCTGAQAACRDAPQGVTGNGEGLEIPGIGLDLVSFYASNLAVPARRDPGEAQVLAGKMRFHAAGCAACHQPKFVTHRLEDRPEQSFQLIWPYTDMLLHDMGEGLADDVSSFSATGAEWRTPPLWGIGLTETVGEAAYLHDGRARSLVEAILWHGGEGLAAREAFRAMDETGRAALIAFLESL